MADKIVDRSIVQATMSVERHGGGLADGRTDDFSVGRALGRLKPPTVDDPPIGKTGKVETGQTGRGTQPPTMFRRRRTMYAYTNTDLSVVERHQSSTGTAGESSIFVFLRRFSLSN